MANDDSGALRIREMRPSDRDFILELTSRLEAVGAPPWRDPEAIHRFHQHYADGTVNASGPDEAVFVAESDEEDRLGIVHVLESKDGLTGERQGYVATLAVTAEAEGRGVGRQLMARAEDWCHSRGHRIVSLEVFAQNTGARTFYSRLGYQEETLKLIKVIST